MSFLIFVINSNGKNVFGRQIYNFLLSKIVKNFLRNLYEIISKILYYSKLHFLYIISHCGPTLIFFPFFFSLFGEMVYIRMCVCVCVCVCVHFWGMFVCPITLTNKQIHIMYTKILQLRKNIKNVIYL